MSNDKSQPLISVVTVCYNAVSTIEETIISVINQSYDNIEYIIIDGGSKDGTIDLIEKYADKISYWISEPDRGIYDAMNKGIDVATGKWINFMNSGDTFHSYAAVQEVVENLLNEADVIYCDTMLVYSSGNILQKAFPLSAMNNHLPFCHQSCLINAIAIKKYRYDIKFKLCADYNFFYNLYKEGSLFIYLPICLSNYEAEEGLSAKRVFEVIRESGEIRGKDSAFLWRLYLLFLSCYMPMSRFVKKILSFINSRKF